MAINGLGATQPPNLLLGSVDINPAIAYRINDWLHVGGGISVQIANASLENSVDSGRGLFRHSPMIRRCARTRN